MASIPFPGVSVQSIVDHWTPSLDFLPSMESITSSLDSITPEMAFNAVGSTLNVVLIANVTLLALAAIATLSRPKEQEETPSRDIAPLKDPVIPLFPVCPQCNRSMDDFQVILINPVADFDWV